MGYHFNSRSCTIEIEDRKYSVAVNEGLSKKIESSKKKIESAKGSNNSEIVISAADGAIDDILGKGSADTIFAGREKSAFERLDVLAYIYTEITAFTNEIRGGGNVYKAPMHNRNRRRKNSR